VQKQYQDSRVATIGAVILYFYAPDGTTKYEVLCVRPDWKKVFGILVESLSAERTGYPGDVLRAHSNRVHHPENSELFAAIGTPGDKLIGHEALTFPDFR
jgi:hypothetical protein